MDDGVPSLLQLPENVLNPIAFFLTTSETAAVSAASTSCRFSFAEALAFCWEIFVDSKKHTVSDNW